MKKTVQISARHSMCIAITFLCGWFSHLYGSGWEAWQGPNNTFSAGWSNTPYITNLVSMQPLWLSADNIPEARCADARTDQQDAISGGYASPVMEGDKVYLYYYQPGGTIYSTALYNRTNYIYTNGVTRDKWLISADEVIQCFDANSGATVWKRIFRDRGINMGISFNKSGPQLTPCVSNNRVFAMGTTCHLFAVDATSGDSLWEVKVGRGAARRDALRSSQLNSRTEFQFNRDMLTNVACVDNAVVVNDNYYLKDGVLNAADYIGNSYHAYDAATGDSLWKLDQMAGMMTTPMPWKDKYVLVSSDTRIPEYVRPAIRCVRARTGQIMWTLDKAIYQWLPAVTDSMLVCLKWDSLSNTTSIAGFRIDTLGAREKWTMAGDVTSNFLIHNGDLYFENSTEVVRLNINSGAILSRMSNASFSLDENMSFLVGSGNRIFYGGGRYGFLSILTPDLQLASSSSVVPSLIAEGYACQMTPALYNDRMYVRYPTKMACIDLKAGGAAIGPLTNTSALSSPEIRVQHAHGHAQLTVNFQDSWEITLVNYRGAIVAQHQSSGNTQFSVSLPSGVYRAIVTAAPRRSPIYKCLLTFR